MIKGRLAKYEPIKSGEAKLSIYVDKAMMPEVLPLDGNEVVIMSKEYWESLPREESQDHFNLLIDIRTRCQQIRDLITKELEPIPSIPIATLDLKGIADIGTADGAEPLILEDTKLG